MLDVGNVTPYERLRRWWLGAEYARIEDMAGQVAADYVASEAAVRALRAEFDLHRAFLRDTGQLQALDTYRARVQQMAAQEARNAGAQ